MVRAMKRPAASQEVGEDVGGDGEDPDLSSCMQECVCVQIWSYWATLLHEKPFSFLALFVGACA